MRSSKPLTSEWTTEELEAINATIKEFKDRVDLSRVQRDLAMQRVAELTACLEFYAAGANWLSTPGPESALMDDCGNPLPTHEMAAALKDHGDRARAALGWK